ncbi:iron-containing redox enzyme family protein [Actinoplanes palleronii]|uniref:Iron-containing redox enzyme family protein n=1 Tax=Actinoplanes palleronii TaxID=113570 RepID=A0ABQ4BA74_9ACTN|nr:iron-containing redox enzyme family protein [Actinoplanes palleronii]GIE67565.1 hypothetical protein Apa02nite_036730 [Actinoplanes palleronii]
MATTTVITDENLATAFPADLAAVPAEGNALEAVRQDLFRTLHAHYAAYLSAPEDFTQIPRLNTDPAIARLEQTWLGWEDAQVDLDRLPRTAEEFPDWFRALSANHVQPEFCRYLAEDATIAELALFFLAEELVDSRFDDLVALAQLGSSGAMKLVIGENYWDEMGQGSLDRMHTVLFEHSARYMRERLAEHGYDADEVICAEIFENASLTLMYGIHRHLIPRSVGALGLMEHSAPPRFTAMVAGCTRLGVPEDVITYQRIHVHVDEDHGAEWLDNVLTPLVETSPALLREICLGILTRERVANAYYQRVWQQMKALR